MLVLLSPAKKLNFPEAPAGCPSTQPRFKEKATTLVEEVRKLDCGALQALMKISPALAALNVERFHTFAPSPKTPRARQAIFAYCGDTYKGLAPAGLTAEDLNYAQKHLRILSGLYGLLRPLDLIQPYRLEMKTRLANPAGEDLYAFWGDTLCRAIDQEAAGGPVINLASNEYWKAVQENQLRSPVITPVFKEIKAGKAKVIGLYAKQARGMMARHITVNRLEDPQDLLSFTAGGYAYQPSLSCPGTLVFTRQAA